MFFCRLRNFTWLSIYMGMSRYLLNFSFCPQKLIELCHSVKVTVLWVSGSFVTVQWRWRLLWVHCCQWCWRGAQGHWGHSARYWFRVLYKKQTVETHSRWVNWWISSFSPSVYWRRCHNSHSCENVSRGIALSRARTPTAQCDLDQGWSQTGLQRRKLSCPSHR